MRLYELSNLTGFYAFASFGVLTTSVMLRLANLNASFYGYASESEDDRIFSSLCR